MEWNFLLSQMSWLSFSCIRLRLFYFGEGQSSIKMVIQLIGSLSEHFLLVWPLRMASLCLEFLQFLYPSLLVLFSFCLAGAQSFLLLSQSADTGIDWVRIGEFVSIVTTFFIAVSGWRTAKSQAKKAEAEANKTDADAIQTITNAVNSALTTLLPPLEKRISDQDVELKAMKAQIRVHEEHRDKQDEEIAHLSVKVKFLEDENMKLKVENTGLRARVVELESKLPNESR